MLPRRDPHAAPAAPRSQSRALVALAPEPHPQPSPVYRDTAFLAQLIANKDQHPQTRERRRAEPEAAIAAYNAVAALTARH